jgi:glycerol uptake facilitator-like aquaporin
LANALATAAMLYVLVEWFGPISGAHFNPLVSFALASRGDLPWRHVLSYMAAQVAGAVAGVGAANLMFGLDAFAWSQHARSGFPQWLSEGVATFGLLGLIWTCSRTRPSAIPALVAAYIGAAYWFTASTSFANPAVTLARTLTDSFAGIRPVDVPGFLTAQLVGAGMAIGLFGWLIRDAKAATTRQQDSSKLADNLI